MDEPNVPIKDKYYYHVIGKDIKTGLFNVNPIESNLELLLLKEKYINNVM